MLIRRLLVPLLLAPMVALAPRAAVALTRAEVACQMAIGKASQAFLAAELADGARCKMRAALGKTCDPERRSWVRESKLRDVLSKCQGVSLANLTGGGCAAEASTLYFLAACLASSHRQLAAQALEAEFGLAAAEKTVVVSGTMAQATSTLLPPAHLARYRAIGTAPLSLSDLKLFCLTFAEPVQSASAMIAADGSFSIALAAAGVPFGCFVVDAATGEQVASLVLRGAAGDSTQVQGIAGILPLGTVTLDLGRGEAVASQGPNVCADGVTSPADVTGEWQFTCTPPPAGSGYSCPKAGEGGPDRIYLHRVPGSAADGSPRFWLGVWQTIDDYRTCGQVEGIEPGAGETLGIPDAPFAYAGDAAVEAAMDPVTDTAPWGGQGVCNTTAAHCSDVRNNDGNGCQTGPGCWGQGDMSTFTPYTDAQCRALCYADNQHGHDGGPVRQALLDAGLCVEERIVDWSASPGAPGFLRRAGNPGGRFLLDRLTYTCNDAASVVHRFPTEVVGLPMPPNTPGPPAYCHMTRRAELTVKLASPTRILGDFKESASLAPDDPAACSDDSDPQNWVAQQVLRGERTLFTLTR